MAFDVKKMTLPVFTLALALAGCSEKSGKTSVSSSDFFPSLSFDIPSSVSGVVLTRGTSGNAVVAETTPKTPIERMALRMDKAITHINKLLDRLDTDEVKAAGSFTGKGPDGKVSGTVTELTDDETYKYEAVICHDNTVFQHIKWSADGKKVTGVRNFGVDPMGDKETADFFVRIDYEAGDTQTTLTGKAFGAPWHKPADIEDGENLAEFSYMVKDSAGDITLTGVNDWYDTAPTDNVFEGEDYIVGKLESDGTGEFVAYREVDCDGAFDETDSTAPGWCHGRSVATSGVGSTEFTEDEIADAWERLASIGVSLKTNLAEVALEADLACPE